MARTQNLTGMALMIAAMACFAIGDSLIKWVSADLPVGQILALLGAGGGTLFALMARARGVAPLAPDFLRRAVILRNACEIVGTLCFITALSLIDISMAAAILQATPLAVTLGAALLLQEPVGWRRYSALAVGFVGVLIMLRPGMGGFDPLALWAIAGMLALSMRDLSTRMIPATVPTLRVSTYGMSMLLPAGLALLAINGGAQPMQGWHWAYMAGAVIVGATGYHAITSAMRMGDISVVSPFRYARMVFALIIGIAFFGERPDLATLIGVSLTIAAGLYTFMRERQKRPALAPR
jgi:drug/metabolite transporter (DMT)-like permease